MTIKSNTPAHDKDCWQTPLWLFDALDIEFGFWLDSAASDKNALCAHWLTEADDALNSEWVSHGAIWNNGGGWFFNLDYDKEILAKALAHKADELPLIIELVSKGKKYVICHADYPCDEYEFGKPVDHQQVIWNRERIGNSQDGIVKEIKGVDTFIFGHTPAVKPLKFANQMYIDTGAVFCGNLTLIQVQGEGAWA